MGISVSTLGSGMLDSIGGIMSGIVVGLVVVLLVGVEDSSCELRMQPHAANVATMEIERIIKNNLFIGILLNVLIRQYYIRIFLV